LPIIAGVRQYGARYATDLHLLPHQPTGYATRDIDVFRARRRTAGQSGRGSRLPGRARPRPSGESLLKAILRSHGANTYKTLRCGRQNGPVDGYGKRRYPQLTRAPKMVVRRSASASSKLTGIGHPVTVHGLFAETCGSIVRPAVFSAAGEASAVLAGLRS
jgi:hypothetical protein